MGSGGRWPQPVFQRPYVAHLPPWRRSRREDAERIEEITVTGSRLIRRDLDAPSPVVIVSEAAIRSAGNVTIEETLNEMPQLASDNTSSVNSGGGSGILTADLRGLNAERTLVPGKRPEIYAGRLPRPDGLEQHSETRLVDRVEIVTRRRIGCVRFRRNSRCRQLHPEGRFRRYGGQLLFR